MERYEVTAPMGVTMPAGAMVGGLSAEQVRRRAGALEGLGDGMFKVLRPVMFKRGETLDLAGTSVNKAMMAELIRDPPEAGTARAARGANKGKGKGKDKDRDTAAPEAATAIEEPPPAA